MPSERYEQSIPFFDKVFGNGVDAYVHPTGVVGVKLVVGVAEHNLNPYFSSPTPQRAKNSGDVSIFLADTIQTAYAELFRNNSFSGYPLNSWCLSYRYSGELLNINLIPDDQFKAKFLNASGDYKHDFSQDARHYLSEKGYTDKFDSIGWTSVQGGFLGIGGFVCNWVSGVKTDFEFLGKVRLDTGV
jgi:hypothetical protein